MRAVIRWVPCLTLLAVSPAALGQAGPSAQAPPAFEATPFIGYRTGGKLEVAGTGESIRLEDQRSFALALNLRIDIGSQYELFYGRQSTRLEPNAVVGPVDVKIDYLHIGGTLVVNDEQRLKPYIVGGVGATRFRPQPAEARDSTKFSLSIGGGLRIPISERFSVRLEARGFLTFVNTDSSFFCASGSLGGTCAIRADGNTFIQYEALAGAAYAF
jgi:opacity protein-like surface antigen